MNKDAAMKWVEMLRSGKIVQIKESLHTDRGMCCLGVLASMSSVPGVVIGIIHGMREYDGYCGVLSPKIMTEFDLCSSVGGRRDEGQILIQGAHFACLTEANDNGATFAQIADYIETNWEFL